MYVTREPTLETEVASDIYCKWSSNNNDFSWTLRKFPLIENIKFRMLLVISNIFRTILNTQNMQQINFI